MATGDENPGKVDTFLPNGRKVPDILSADESSPIIIEPDELVCPEETNPSLYSILFNELILCYHTNINLNKLRTAHPEIVCRLETILKTEKGGAIAARIHEAKVFAIPTLVHHFRKTHNLTYKRAKPYVYEIKTALECEKIIEWTPYEAVHPNTRYPGPRAHFYKLTGVGLNGREDPLVIQAQKEYEACYLSFDVQAKEEWSARDRLNRVSMLIADQLIDKSQIYTNPTLILGMCKAEYPQVKPIERQEVVRRVSLQLKEHREGSP